MEPTKEQIEAYRHMIADGMSMEDKIREELSKTCDKFAGHEDRMAGCLAYLQECAKEILNSKNGDVPDEVCYRICRDYFNDEIWKKEDEEKAERKKKQAERAAQNTAKKKVAEERKKAAEAKKAEAARKKAEALAKKKAEAEAKKKAEEERKAAELMRMKEEAEREAKKFPTCRVCGREVVNVYKEGMCLDCYYKRPMQAEKTTAQTAQIQPEQGQLDLFASMGGV